MLARSRYVRTPDDKTKLADEVCTYCSFTEPNMNIAYFLTSQEMADWQIVGTQVKK
jgi:hypothetical protein